MKLKLQENITAVTFRIDNTDFYVEITHNDNNNSLEAELYSYGYQKDFLTGIEGGLNNIEEFICMLEDYILRNNCLEEYEEKYM